MSAQRHIAVWTAWAAVYAFVLNAFLAAFLLAATPTALADDHALCLTTQSSAQGPAGDVGTTERVATHCKQCLPGFASAPIPPAAPDVFQRIAVAMPRQVAFELRLKQFARFTQTSPRGPPSLI